MKKMKELISLATWYTQVCTVVGDERTHLVIYFITFPLKHPLLTVTPVANKYGMNEMQIMTRFIFRSDLTSIKLRVSLSSS